MSRAGMRGARVYENKLVHDARVDRSRGVTRDPVFGASHGSKSCFPDYKPRKAQHSASFRCQPLLLYSSGFERVRNSDVQTKRALEFN